MRAARRALTSAAQRAHADAVARHVMTSQLPLFARRIALYAPTDGELDPSPLVDALLARHRIVALPVVLPDRLLGFYRYTARTRLVTNRYGILEPDTRIARYLERASLDAVLLPLVAFDAAGHRLGMGGGYYDATFGRTRARPLLVGLAHALQRVEVLAAAPWDIALDAVVTETGIVTCTGRGARIRGTTASAEHQRGRH